MTINYGSGPRGFVGSEVKGLVDKRPLGIIAVTEFGAKGDGEADDTKAFKDLFDFVDDDMGVYIPEGHYIIEEGINVENELVIKSNNATIEKIDSKDDEDDGIFTINAPCYIENLKLKEGSEQEDKYGLVINEGSHCTNVYVINGKHSFYVTAGITVLDNCTAEHEKIYTGEPFKTYSGFTTNNLGLGTDGVCILRDCKAKNYSVKGFRNRETTKTVILDNFQAEASEDGIKEEAILGETGENEKFKNLIIKNTNLEKDGDMKNLVKCVMVKNVIIDNCNFKTCSSETPINIQKQYEDTDVYDDVNLFVDNTVIEGGLIRVYDHAKNAIFRNCTINNNSASNVFKCSATNTIIENCDIKTTKDDEIKILNVLDSVHDINRALILNSEITSEYESDVYIFYSVGIPEPGKLQFVNTKIGEQDMIEFSDHETYIQRNLGEPRKFINKSEHSKDTLEGEPFKLRDIIYHNTLENEDYIGWICTKVNSDDTVDLKEFGSIAT